MLQGRYLIFEAIGQGGMGAVYKGVQTELQTPVAIKEMLHAASAFATAFRAEARILQQLKHPALPRVYDFFAEGDNLYLVMEFISGDNLFDIVRAQGRINEASVLRFAGELCDVLHYLHTHHPPVIFRDLKPSNVMLADDGHLRLIDFGIAKLFDPATGAGTATVIKGCGSPGYAPPEQYSGTTDQRTDVYALGATLYALLTATSPPESHEIASGIAPRAIEKLAPDVSARTSAAVMQMMTLDRKQRPESMRAVTELLLGAPPQKPRSWTPVLMGGLALVVLGTGVASFIAHDEPGPVPSPVAVASPTPSPLPSATPAPVAPVTEAAPLPVVTPTPRATPSKRPVVVVTPQVRMAVPPVAPVQTVAPTAPPVPAVASLAIVPGRGVTGVPLGASITEVLSRMPGASSTPANGSSIAYYWAEQKLTAVSDGYRVETLLVDDARYRTPAGIGVGSTLADVTRAFGTPTVTRDEQVIYTDRGIAFDLQDKTVVRVELFSTGP